MTGWWQLLAAGLGGGGLAGILGSLLTGLWQRPKVRADAVAMLTDSALKQVNELQERTAEAEREATAARNDLAQARQQIRLLTTEIDAALTTMRLWRAAILAPSAELEFLREMVRADPGQPMNGRSK
jgi:chromosome segregation ATPase